MAETFEEQAAVVAYRRLQSDSGSDPILLAGHIAVDTKFAIRANPAPVLALLSDDALRAACRERGIGLAEDMGDDELDAELNRRGWEIESHCLDCDERGTAVLEHGASCAFVDNPAVVPVYVGRGAREAGERG